MMSPRNAMAVFGISLVLVITGWLALRSTFEVCFTLNPARGYAQLYWDHGQGFSERESRIARPGDRGGPQRLCLAAFRTRGATDIRIDPVQSPGVVAISEITLTYIDNLVPFVAFNRYVLDPAAAVTADLQADADTGLLVARGGDPWMVWAVPRQQLGGVVLLAINLLVVVCALAALVVGLRLLGVREGAIVAASPVLLLFPAFTGLAWLSDHFVSLVRFLPSALWVSVAAFAVIAILPARGEDRLSNGLAWAGVLGLALIIALDIPFRLGLSQRPVIMQGDNAAWHWRLGTETRTDGSAARYAADLHGLGDAAEPGYAFLSDVATSYYVAASQPLYATNTHRHHSRNSADIARLISQLCHADADGMPAVMEAIGALNRQRARARLPEIRYLVVNRDGENPNVRGNCLADTMPALEGDTAAWVSRLFSGEFLDLFELRFTL